MEKPPKVLAWKSLRDSALSTPPATMNKVFPQVCEANRYVSERSQPALLNACAGMRTLLEFDPLCRPATRELHYGQERKLHKQAGYICANPNHSRQRFRLQSDGGPYNSHRPRLAMHYLTDYEDTDIRTARGWRVRRGSHGALPQKPQCVI